MIRKIFLISIILMAGLICPLANAKVTVNSSLAVCEISDTSITWNYSYLTDNRPLGATLDGVIIEGWKTDLIYNYTASNLVPGTTHEFCIFDDATVNCEVGATSDTMDLSEEIQPWWYLLLIMGCCIIGMMRRLGFFHLIASAVSLYGLYEFIQYSELTETDPLMQILFYIYIAFFIVPLWLVWGVKKGVFK